MNPVISLILILGLGLEITFTNSVIINVLLILASALVILFNHPQFKVIIALILTPLLPAVGTFVAQLFYGNWQQGIVVASRIIAYVWLGSAYLKVCDEAKLIRTFEQVYKLPTQVIYGVYAALNLIPQIQHAIIDIRWAARMRGVNLSFWSPTLYFKALQNALRYSDELVLAMHSHGFRERNHRTYVTTVHVAAWQYLLLIILLVIIPVSRLVLN